MPRVSGRPGEQAASILSSLTAWLEEQRPDALLLLGDRFEMLAAAQAATLARIPIIHIGGGHLTLGAIDERIRHAITKLSAVHFVASEACGQRVAALNEDDRRIFVTGAPEIDALVSTPSMSRSDFCSEVGLDPARPILLCTFHPETNVDEESNVCFSEQAKAVLMSTPLQILISAPCADPGNEPFLKLCLDLSRQRADCRGFARYAAALRHASVMLGNSSSGIIEAATVGLPVVNVGIRQAMRDRAPNVIDCDFTTDSMNAALATAHSQEFVARCKGIKNPYGDGTFSPKALAALASLSWPIPVDKRWSV